MPYFEDVTPAAAAIAAVAAASGRDRAGIICCHPVVRVNHFQALMYSAAPDLGFLTYPVLRTEDLPAVAIGRSFGPTWLHLHWTSRMRPDEDRDGERVLATLARLRDVGVKVVWTLHNSLPHNCPDPDTEVEFRRRLVDLVDLVHVMSSATRDAVDGLYPLPAHKVFVVPHPSYADSYATFFHRDVVRTEMGLAPRDQLVGLIGSIQPYKGIDELLTAIATARGQRPHLKALIGGVPGRDDASRDLIARIRSHPWATSVPRQLDDVTMARMVASLDVMALPYRATLNSGAAALALTFRKPVIAPALPAFVDMAARELCLTYDPADPSGLADALLSFPDFEASIPDTAFDRWLRDHDPRTISRRFVQRLLDHDAAGA